MFSELYELALIVAVPWGLRLLVSTVRGDKGDSVAPKEPYRLPTTPWKHPTSLVLLAAIIGYAVWGWAVLPLQRNFFDEIGAPYDAPNYVVRNYFRDYTNYRLAEDPSFDEPIVGLRPPRTALPTAGDAAEAVEGISRRDWMIALNKLLRASREDRHHYLTYGEDAFVSCVWCRDGADFFLYAAPDILWSYLGFVLVLYAGTMSTTRAYWRTWTLIYAMLLLSMEMSLLLLPREQLHALVPAPLLYLPQSMGMLRCTVWVIQLVLVFGVQRRIPTTEERLVRLLDVDERTMTLWRSLQLHQLAVMDDEALLVEFVKFHRGRQMERQQIRDDPEVEQVRRRVLARASGTDATNWNNTGE